MAGINGFPHSNTHFNAVNTASAKRTGGIKAKENEGKLSQKAADFLAKLKEERPDFDFSVSDGRNIKGLAAKSDKEYSVMFSSEELEKMADDPEFAKEQMDKLDKIVDMSDKIVKDDTFTSLFGADAESKLRMNTISFSVSDNGEIKISADVKKPAEIAKNQFEKVNDKTEKKSLKENDVLKAKKDKASEVIKIEAAGLADFLEKLKNIA